MKILKFTTLAVLLLLIVGLGAFGIANSRAATETPDYEVLEQDGKFEIRRYGELRMATAPMQESGRLNSPFRKLFAYITGANETEEKISMTTPVLMEENTTGQRVMSFILPADKSQNAPTPKGDVELTTFPPGKYAALRFRTNGRTPQDDADATALLVELIKEKGLVTTGSAVVAYYDPPWIPTFLRRNEILIRLADMAIQSNRN